METQGRIKEAMPIALEARKTSHEVLGDAHWTTTAAMNQLGSLYTLQGRYKEAEPLLLKSVELAQNLNGKEHASAVFFTLRLVKLYKAQARYNKMDSVLARILKTAQQTYVPGHAVLGFIQEEVRQRLIQLGIIMREQYSTGHYKNALLALAKQKLWYHLLLAKDYKTEKQLTSQQIQISKIRDQIEHAVLQKAIKLLKER